MDDLRAVGDLSYIRSIIGVVLAGSAHAHHDDISK